MNKHIYLHSKYKTLTATQAQEIPTSFIKDFFEMTKVRLSISVVISSIAGYLLGADKINYLILLALLIGGYCMVGASNVFNQIIERDTDALMGRTKNRPLASGRVSVQKGMVIGVVLALIGISVLYLINPKTAMFGAISIFMYTSLYTPLKTKTSLSVFVGAFPGAIPFMLGWVAATNNFGIEAGTLFLIQFFWQFPHFWAIGWFLYEDYAKADIFMLPNKNKDKGTALQIVLYSVWTLITSLIPLFGLTGSFKISGLAAVVVGVLGLWLIFNAIKLYKEQSSEAAKKLLLVSVGYISLLQLIYVLDKFFIQ